MNLQNQTVGSVDSGDITTDTTTVMTNRQKTGGTPGGDVIEAGGRIIITTGPATITITDSDGVVLHAAAAVSSSKDIDPIPRGIRLPISVITTSLTGTARVIWWFKR